MTRRFVFIPLLLLILGIVIAVPLFGGEALGLESDETSSEQTSPEPAATGSTAAITDCGSEVRSLGRDRNLPSRDCLFGAYNAGKAATWSTTMPTIEGDPIVFKVAVDAKGGVTVEIDNTKDRFTDAANRGIKTYRCDKLAVDPLAMPPLFVASGCNHPETGEIRF